MTYKYFYDSNGSLSCVNDEDTGATVYIPNSPHYTAASNPLTAEFLATNPDLSDRPDLAQPITPQPDWQGLLNEFRLPGNALYMAIVAKVASAGFMTQDHWQNFKTLIFSPELQDVGALAIAMSHLSNLLTDAGQGLSAEEVDLWNTMLALYNFPEECRL